MVREGYLVVPFENEAAIRSLDWMAPALAVTLAEQLEAQPGLQPAYGSSILEGFGAKFDSLRIADRARDLGARWVVSGGFARPNWKAEIKLRLYQVVTDGPLPDLKLVAQAGAIGERTALIQVLDQALGELLKRQGWLPELPGGEQILRVPTKDLYAMTLYGRALNLLYGYGGPIDLSGAEKLFQRVTAIDPKFAEAHRMLAMVAEERHELGKAMLHYARALDLRPGYYPVLAGLARLSRERRERAIELAARALEVRPSDVEMRFLLGDLEWEAGELDKALADLTLVTAAQPGHLRARRTLALVYAARGATSELATELEKIAALQPDDLDVRMDLGGAYARLGKHEQALAAYEEVLKRQPRNAQVVKFAGDLYRQVGDQDRAIAAYSKLRNLVPDDPRPYFLLGATYLAAGNDLKAEQVLQEAQQFHRHVGEAWTDLGAIAFRRGDLSKATWYLSRAVQRAPTRPKAHFNYALLLNATKQRERALGELKVAAELDPEDAQAHYLAGVIHLRMGKLEEAKQAFLAALKRKPDHADAKFNLGLLEELERRYGAERAGVGSQ